MKIYIVQHECTKVSSEGYRTLEEAKHFIETRVYKEIEWINSYSALTIDSLTSNLYEIIEIEVN